MYRSIFAAILAVTSAGAYAADGAEQLEKAHSRISAQASTTTDHQSVTGTTAHPDQQSSPQT
ncbi:hypothetical protein [Pseudomonas sp. PLMAX]|jgi:hypothetical protein|uniref:hypothetical protein n=1 Tax=Pseudomonas sp. PLMAX TaxID=2201998 RepID=UPI0038B840CC